ncbi:MAG: hypothetical protein ACLQRH_10675 [Acidimicrobiales bacterium]
MEHTASSTAIRGELTELVSQQSGGLRTIPAPVDTLTIGDSSPSPYPSVSDRAAPRRSWPSRAFRRLTSEAGVVALIAFAAYLTVAILLDFKYQILPLDAVSRMANGYYVLWSRDPHLAAIGFVWSPLQSAADIPLLLFKPVFPVLATHDLAGSIVSVLAGVGAVHQVHAALREWGVRRAPRLALTLIFGINPMVLYYAGNGMSDMLYTFLLVMTTRYFLRWLHDGGMRPLVYAGSALGLAYLDRYEALGAAGMAAVVVLGVSYWRSHGQVRARFMAASADALIFLSPLVATFLSWAVMSYVITGQAFPGISSQYGTSAQTSESVQMTFAVRASHGFHNVEYLAPLLLVVLILAIFFAARRRDLRILAPLAILGGSVTFDALGLLTGFLEPWYRYFIVSVPLDVMLVGCILAQGSSVATNAGVAPAPVRASSVKWRRTRELAVGAFGVVVVVALLGVSVPSAGRGIFAGTVQSSESTELGALFLAHPTKTEVQWTHHYAHIQSIDAYIGNMHLPDGSIVADTYGNCTPQIVTSVPNSKVFVIINDRDFQRILADPLTFGAHYLFVPQPVGVGLVDALNEKYPTLYANGAGFAKLVHQFNSDGICAPYRLYRVTGHNGQTAQS